MKFKKIFLSFILCFLTVVLVACSGSPMGRVATVSEDDELIMTVYAYDGKGESKFGLLNLGHSFLSFENKSDDAVFIGEFELAPNEIVTVSTWSISGHFGVWYNVENNYIKYHDKYNGRYSISIGLGLDCLDKIDKYIESNDSWLPTKNCTNFTVGLWNKLCPKKARVSTPLIYTPAKLVKDIKTFAGYEKNKAIPVSDRFGYFDSNKNFVKYAFESAVVGGGL